MSIDFNNAPMQGSFSIRQLDQPNYIPDLKRRMESDAESILFHLFPAGHVQGNEFVVGDFGGNKGESLKISLKKGKVGVGKDFASDESAGDLIDVWALATGRTCGRSPEFSDIVEEIENFLGGSRSNVVPITKTWDGHQNKEGWWSHPPKETYLYKDQDGNYIGHVQRIEYEKNGKIVKETIPHIGKKPGAPEFRFLYNQDKIKDVDTVIWVEGEKCCNALNARGISATTSMGGSKVPGEKIDWSPIYGKTIIVWPDADQPGQEYAQMVARHAKQAGAVEVRILELPDGLEEGWDCADAIEEGIDVRGFIEKYDPHQPVKSRLEFKSASEYSGSPEPVQWLVGGSIPLGVPAMVAAMGDTGKSYLLLDLAVRVACGEHPADSPIFGGHVCQEGTAVYITSEDPDNEIHRRLTAIDPDLDRIKNCKDRLLVLPLPDRGGAAPIIEQTAKGIYPTENWTEIRNSLLAIKDLKLIIFDPLQSFCLADINADPAAGQYFCSMITSLASETGATVVVAHHMRKQSSKTNGQELSPEEVRELIRGTSALVDGIRLTYALWRPVAHKQARETCKRLGRSYTPNCMAYGAVVKANGPAPREIATYLRSPAGLLIDQSERLKNVRPYEDNDVDDLVACVEEAAQHGHPFSRTGLSSPFKRKEDIPEPFRVLARSSLESIIDDLIVNGRIVSCNAGGKIKNVLDVPGGDFAQGIGQFEPGTYTASRAQSA